MRRRGTQDLGVNAVFRSLREAHDTVFSSLDKLPEEQQEEPDLRSAALQLFLVDSEVLRNLSELYTGENLDPDMLSREDHEEWFKRSHQRMGDWGVAEVVNRARQVRNDLLHQLLQPLPPFLEENDRRILDLVGFSLRAANNVSSVLARFCPPGTG